MDGFDGVIQRCLGVLQSTSGDLHTRYVHRCGFRNVYLCVDCRKKTKTIWIHCLAGSKHGYPESQNDTASASVLVTCGGLPRCP